MPIGSEIAVDILKGVRWNDVLMGDDWNLFEKLVRACFNEQSHRIGVNWIKPIRHTLAFCTNRCRGKFSASLTNSDLICWMLSVSRNRNQQPVLGKLLRLLFFEVNNTFWFNLKISTCNPEEDQSLSEPKRRPNTNLSHPWANTTDSYREVGFPEQSTLPSLGADSSKCSEWMLIAVPR